MHAEKKEERKGQEWDEAEDRDKHNAFVQELIDDVDWEPLKQFLERLKESPDA
jgi:hypothetical protein